MSDEKIINHMIDFIAVKETDFIYDTGKVRKKESQMVDSIIKELEQELKNEDK